MIKLSEKIIIGTAILLSTISTAYAWDKGIYLTQYTLEQPAKLDHLISEAKATGINTFIIDHEYYSSHYAPAIAKVKAAGIKDVARIIVFSDGGNAQQIHSQAHWEEKMKLAQDAIKAGADAVQLDYIRYSSKEPANPQHAKDVYQIIKWFKTRINAEHNTPMEIDIFGEVSYYPSMHIGQDIKMFADSVDGVNPMVYPSHFWPYQKYSAQPYHTINNSLNALEKQFNNNAPFKVHAFIEAANYHYVHQTSNAEKQKYLLQEIHAVEDANNVAGWYVWSANNVYDNLFQVLRNNKIKSADNEKTEHHPEADAADMTKINYGKKSVSDADDDNEKTVSVAEALRDDDDDNAAAKAKTVTAENADKTKTADDNKATTQE